MRKIVSVLLILCLCFTFAGCQKEKPVKTVVKLHSEENMKGKAYSAIEYWKEYSGKRTPRPLAGDFDDFDILNVKEDFFYLKYDLNEENVTTQSVYGVYVVFTVFDDMAYGDFDKYMKARSWEQFLHCEMVILPSENLATGSIIFNYFRFRLDLHYYNDGEFDYANFQIGYDNLEITEDDKDGSLYFVTQDSRKEVEL